MSELWLAKVRRGDKVGLIATDEDSRAVLGRMKDNEVAAFTIVRPRSVPMHRMYMGICREIGKNQDPPRSESSIDYQLRIMAGHFDVVLIDDERWKLPKRIAFDKLTHDEWMELWPSLELAIREHFGHEYIREQAA